MIRVVLIGSNDQVENNGKMIVKMHLRVANRWELHFSGNISKNFDRETSKRSRLLNNFCTLRGL